MRKTGFTLTEMLITLGIIGVIATLTLPTLMNDSRRKEVGPKLAKAVAAFEQANLALLNHYNASNFLSYDYESEKDIIDKLTQYIKMTETSTYPSISLDNSGTCNDISGIDNKRFFLTKDGTAYIIAISDISKAMDNIFTYIENPYHKPMGKVIIDTNGKAAPNRAGTDIFEFHWLLNGSLVPYGSQEAATKISGASSCNWTKLCPIGGYAVDARACAGHILENNLNLDYIY